MQGFELLPVISGSMGRECCSVAGSNSSRATQAPVNGFRKVSQHKMKEADVEGPTCRHRLAKNYVIWGYICDIENSTTN